MKISGVGYQPRVFGIAVEGYQATTFTINRDTSAEVEVLMSRLKGR